MEKFGAGEIAVASVYTFITQVRSVQRHSGLELNVVETRLIYFPHSGLIQICRYDMCVEINFFNFERKCYGNYVSQELASRPHPRPAPHCPFIKY